jgi:hypothetical protein
VIPPGRLELPTPRGWPPSGYRLLRLTSAPSSGANDRGTNRGSLTVVSPPPYNCTFTTLTPLLAPPSSPYLPQLSSTRSPPRYQLPTKTPSSPADTLADSLLSPLGQTLDRMLAYERDCSLRPRPELLPETPPLRMCGSDLGNMQCLLDSVQSEEAAFHRSFDAPAIGDLASVLRAPIPSKPNGGGVSALFTGGGVDQSMMDLLGHTSPQTRSKYLQKFYFIQEHQYRKNTLLKVRAPYERWVAFATERGVNPVPSLLDSPAATRERLSCWNWFAVAEFIRAESAPKRPHEAKTYRDVFYSVNLVLTKIMFSSRLETPRQKACMAAYTQNYSRASTQARPLLFCHLQRLWEKAREIDEEWFWVVTHVITIMWFTGCRWDCIKWLNVALTWADLTSSTRAQLDYMLFYFGQRKNMKCLSSTPVPKSVPGADFGADSSFRFLVSKYGRLVDNELGLIPWCSKSGAGFKVLPDSTKVMTYDQFRTMYEMAMKRCGLPHSKLHGPRVGFASQNMQSANPLDVRRVQAHLGHTSVESTHGYNNVSPADHAASVARSIASFGPLAEVTASPILDPGNLQRELTSIAESRAAPSPERLPSTSAKTPAPAPTPESRPELEPVQAPELEPEPEPAPEPESDPVARLKSAYRAKFGRNPRGRLASDPIWLRSRLE